MVLGSAALANIRGIVIPKKVETASSTTQPPSTIPQSRECKNQLLFSDDYKGSKEDRFSKLMRRMRPVRKDGGVLIEEPLTEEGKGPTIKELVNDEAEAFEQVEDFNMSNIIVWFHYSAYLKDELEEGPFDHSYATGSFDNDPNASLTLGYDLTDLISDMTSDMTSRGMTPRLT